MDADERESRRGPGAGVLAPTGRGIAWVLAALLGAACGNEGPASAPGPLTATVVSPGGSEGGAVVSLVGPGMGPVEPLDGARVFSEARGDTVRVVVVSPAGGVLRFSVHVADTTRPPSATLLEVAGADDGIRSLAGYRVEIRP